MRTVLIAASNSSTVRKRQADIVCTGSADDVLINQVLSSGDVHAQLLDGLFSISAPLVLYANSVLSGLGMYITELRCAIASYANSWTNNTVVRNNNTDGGIEVRDLYINDPVDTAANLLCPQNATGFVAERVRLAGGGANAPGITMLYGSNFRIAGCLVQNTAGTGISAVGASYGQIVKNVVRGTEADEGIGIWGKSAGTGDCVGVVVASNVVEGTAGHGIAISLNDVGGMTALTRDAVIANNIIISPGLNGYDIAGGTKRVRIVGGMVQNAGRYGVSIKKGSHGSAPVNVKITDLVIDTTSDLGVFLDFSGGNLSDIGLHELTIIAATQYGIGATAGAYTFSDITIRDCDILDMVADGGGVADGIGFWGIGNASCIIEELDIQGNHIKPGSGSLRNGIIIGATSPGVCRNSMISNNNVRGASNNNYSLNGTGHTTANNKGA